MVITWKISTLLLKGWLLLTSTVPFPHSFLPFLNVYMNIVVVNNWYLYLFILQNQCNAVISKIEYRVHILFTDGVNFSCFFQLSSHNVKFYPCLPSSISFEGKCCMEYICNVWVSVFNKRNKVRANFRTDNNINSVGPGLHQFRRTVMQHSHWILRLMEPHCYWN